MLVMFMLLVIKQTVSRVAAGSDCVNTSVQLVNEPITTLRPWPHSSNGAEIEWGVTLHSRRSLEM